MEALYACSITLDTTNAEAVLHAATFLGCHPLVCATIAYIAQTYLPHHFLEASAVLCSLMSHSDLLPAHRYAMYPSRQSPAACYPVWAIWTSALMDVACAAVCTAAPRSSAPSICLAAA